MTEIRFEAIVPKHKISAASQAGVVLAMRGMARAAQGRLMKYPPKPPQSTYRRTGTLGRRWTVAGPMKKGNDLEVQVGNKTTYGPYVQGPEGVQVRVHKKTGWPTIDKVGEQEWDKAQPAIKAALQKT